MDVPNLATSAGIAGVVIILVGAVKAALPFDSARWGALLAITLGVALSVANVMLGGVVDDSTGSPIATILIGIMGGAAASGIYDAGKGLTTGRTDPVPEG